MERYDIRPTPTGEWAVIDRGNGGGVRDTYPTRELALREAKRLERGTRT